MVSLSHPFRSNDSHKSHVLHEHITSEGIYILRIKMQHIGVLKEGWSVMSYVCCQFYALQHLRMRDADSKKVCRSHIPKFNDFHSTITLHFNRNLKIVITEIAYKVFCLQYLKVASLHRMVDIPLTVHQSWASGSI